MNEEQSEELLKILTEINQGLKSISREKGIKEDMDIMKLRINTFMKQNKELKGYDIDYLTQVVECRLVGTGYLLTKKRYEQKQMKNDTN